MRSGSGVLLRHFARQKAACTAIPSNASTGRWFRAMAAAGNLHFAQAQIDSNWHWQSVAAAALAFGFGLSHVAYCEPNQQGVWARMSDAIDQTWQAIDEDMHREEATSALHLGRAEAPTLRMDSGRLSITIPIREGVPADLVKNEMLKQMKRLSQAGAGRFFVHKQVVSPGSERMVSTVMPARGSSEGLQAELESHRLRSFVRFAKRGPITDGELAVISAVLRAANLLTGDEAAAVASAQAIRKVRSDIEEDWRRMQEAAPGVMLSIFRDLVASISADVQESEPVAGELKDSASTVGLMHPPWEARHPPQGRPLFDDPSPPGTAEEKFEYGSRRADQAAQKLQSLGAMVYRPTNQDTFDWGVLAGYADQKQQIEDTMLLALKHPHVYEAIAKSTRRQHGNNKPRAVLFEGPPGTGKTTSARYVYAAGCFEAASSSQSGSEPKSNISRWCRV
ncbi:hypothetical protein ABBQ32_012133 [Trebouxia sp. C0010 RCD-2024]